MPDRTLFLVQVRRLEDSESKLRQAVSEQTALSDRVHELEAQEEALVSLEQEKASIAEEADRCVAPRWGPCRRRGQDLAEELTALERRTNTQVSFNQFTNFITRNTLRALSTIT